MAVGVSQQIASDLSQKIESGEWAPSRKLPSTRALAAKYAVSLNTVQSAFRMLEGRGLVVRHPRKGGFVAPAGRDAVAGPATAPAAGTVVLVAPSPGHVVREDLWSYLIIRAAEAELARNGYTLSLWSAYEASADGRPDVLPRIERIRDDFAGAILLPFDSSTPLAAELERRGLVWVSVNQPEERNPANFVAADNYEGGRLVGRCFARAGFDRVAFLGRVQHPANSGMLKFQGFVHGCLEGGVPHRNIDFVSADGTHEPEGYAAFAAHVARFGPPRAVFAAGDLLALAVVRFCRERGLSVPDDVAVVGSTGMDVAQYAHPSLSVLAQPMVELGTEAARMVLARLARGGARSDGRWIPTRLVLRESFTLDPEAAGDLGLSPPPAPSS